MKALLVSDLAYPRVPIIGYVSESPAGYIAFDGSLAAGARAVMALAGGDAYAEMVRIDFDTTDDVRELRITTESAQGGHGYSAMILVDPGDDRAAANLFEQGAATTVRASSNAVIQSPAAIASAYVLVRPAVGATLASVKGRISVEGYANA